MHIHDPTLKQKKIRYLDCLAQAVISVRQTSLVTDNPTYLYPCVLQYIFTCMLAGGRRGADLLTHVIFDPVLPEPCLTKFR